MARAMSGPGNREECAGPARCRPGLCRSGRPDRLEARVGAICSIRKPPRPYSLTSHQKNPIGGQVDEPLRARRGKTALNPKAFRAMAMALPLAEVEPGEAPGAGEGWRPKRSPSSPNRVSSPSLRFPGERA